MDDIFKKKFVKINMDPDSVTELSHDKIVQAKFATEAEFRLKEGSLDKNNAIQIGIYTYTFNPTSRSWVRIVDSADGNRHSHNNLLELDKIPNFPSKPSADATGEYVFKYKKNELGDYTIVIETGVDGALPEVNSTDKSLYLQAKRQPNGKYEYEWDKKDQDFPLPDDSARTKFLISKDGRTEWDAVAIPAQSFEMAEITITAADVANGFVTYPDITFIEGYDTPILFTGSFFTKTNKVEYDLLRRALTLRFSATANQVGETATLLLIKNAAGSIVEQIETLYELYKKYTFTTKFKLYPNKQNEMPDKLDTGDVSFGGNVSASTQFKVGDFLSNVMADVKTIRSQAFYIQIPMSLSIGARVHIKADIYVKWYNDKGVEYEGQLACARKNNIVGTGNEELIQFTLFAGEISDPNSPVQLTNDEYNFSRARFRLVLTVTFGDNAEFWIRSYKDRTFHFRTLAVIQSVNDTSISVSSGGTLQEYIGANNDNIENLYTTIETSKLRWKSIAPRNINVDPSIIEFQTGTQIQYEALKTKDERTLYWLTDTKQIYHGSKLMVDRIQPVEFFPPVHVAQTSVIYLNTKTLESKMANADKTDWLVYTKKNTELVDSYADDTSLPTTKAIKSYVDKKIEDLPKDIFIKDAHYDSITNTIYIKYSAYQSDIEIPLGDLFDIYNGATTPTTITRINSTDYNVLLPSKIFISGESTFIKSVSDFLYASNDGDHWYQMDGIARNNFVGLLGQIFFIDKEKYSFSLSGDWEYIQDSLGNHLTNIVAVEKNPSEVGALATMFINGVNKYYFYEGTPSSMHRFDLWSQLLIGEYGPVVMYLRHGSGKRDFAFTCQNKLFTIDEYKSVSLFGDFPALIFSFAENNNKTYIGRDDGGIDTINYRGTSFSSRVLPDWTYGRPAKVFVNKTTHNTEAIQYLNYTPASIIPKVIISADGIMDDTQNYNFDTPLDTAKLPSGLLCGTAFNHTFISATGETWVHHTESNANTISVDIRVSSDKKDNQLSAESDGLFVPITKYPETPTTRTEYEIVPTGDGGKYNSLKTHVLISQAVNNTLKIDGTGILNERLTPTETTSLKLALNDLNLSGEVKVSKIDQNSISITQDGLVSTPVLVYKTSASFPNVGLTSSIYVDSTANKCYGWSQSDTCYKVIGSDYNDIVTIKAGGAFTQFKTVN